MKQRIFAILLSLTMMFTLVPTAWAENNGITTEAELRTAIENATGEKNTITLAEDIGNFLDLCTLMRLIDKNEGITCVAFMGGDSDPQSVNMLAGIVQTKGLLTAWYSGRQELSKDVDIKNFNFIKLGPYVEELGGLKSPTTNQRMYEVKMCRELDEDGNPIYGLEDITSSFWK